MNPRRSTSPATLGGSDYKDVVVWTSEPHNLHALMSTAMAFLHLACLFLAERASISKLLENHVKNVR
jgi:hypothetical protein